MMMGSCRRRVIEVCRTKKKCGFRGFHTSCSGSQMNPSMEKRSTKRRLFALPGRRHLRSNLEKGTMAYDVVAIKTFDKVPIKSWGHARSIHFWLENMCSLSIPQCDFPVLFLISSGSKIQKETFLSRRARAGGAHPRSDARTRPGLRKRSRLLCRDGGHPSLRSFEPSMRVPHHRLRSDSLLCQRPARVDPSEELQESG